MDGVLYFMLCCSNSSGVSDPSTLLKDSHKCNGIFGGKIRHKCNDIFEGFAHRFCVVPFSTTTTTIVGLH